MDLRWVDGIPSVVSFSVFHVRDQAFRFAQFFTDQFDDIDVPHFVVAAHVVDFSNPALLQDPIDGPAVVFHVQPVPHVEAVSVHRQGFIMECVDDYQGNQFFRELVGTIVVAAPADGHREPVGPVVGQHQQIGPGLGAAVGAGGVDGGGLGKEQIRPVHGQVPVYFIRGNLVEALDAIFSAGVHQHRSADDVRFQEEFRVQNGSVHMGFGGKVDDLVGALVFKESIYGLAVADIHFVELETGMVQDGGQGGKIPGVGQFVQADDVSFRMLLQHIKDKIRADEPGAARYDEFHENTSRGYYSKKESLVTSL